MTVLRMRSHDRMCIVIASFIMLVSRSSSSSITACCAFSPTRSAPPTFTFDRSILSTVQIPNHRNPIVPHLRRLHHAYPKSISTLLFAEDSNDDTNDDSTIHNDTPESNDDSGTSMTTKTNTSLLSRIKSYFTSKSDDGDGDGLTTKQRLAKLGFAVLLSYGFVSNMSAMVFLSLAWFTFSAQTGLSPLAPNQWKPFTLVYAGFYVLSNLVRPLRIGIAITIGKYFDSILLYFQENTRLSRNATIALLVFGANVICTCLALVLGVSLASLFSGVPVFPSKVVGIV